MNENDIKKVVWKQKKENVKNFIPIYFSDNVAIKYQIIKRNKDGKFYLYVQDDFLQDYAEIPSEDEKELEKIVQEKWEKVSKEILKQLPT